MYTAPTTKFKFGGGEKPNVYFDENGRRELLSIRGAYAMLLGLRWRRTGERIAPLRC